MTKVSKSQDKQIIRIDFRKVRNLQYAVVTIGFIGQTFEVELSQSEIRDFILLDLNQHTAWLDENYQNWREESEEEVAEEMASHVWKDKCMIQDYVNSLAVWDMNSVEKISIDKHQAELFIGQLEVQINISEIFRDNPKVVEDLNTILTSAKKLFYQQL